MARIPKTYTLPDTTAVTENVDEHIAAWQSLAQPIEDALNMKLSAYDPMFVFSSSNPQRSGVEILSLPVWFVKRLNTSLTQKTS